MHALDILRTITNLSLRKKEGNNGILFLLLIWLAFFLPAANWSTFPFIIGYTNLSELAIIAMPFVYALYPRRVAIASSTRYSFLRKAILLFFVMSIYVLILQYLVYGGSFEEYFRTNRILIPLYVALSLIYLGPRINPKLLLLNLCLCLSLSFLVSFFFFILDIHFTPLIKAQYTEEDFEVFRQGRLYNVNEGFAYLACGLFLGIGIFRKYLRSTRLVGVILVCCSLSIILSFLGFERTFIIISLLFLLYVNFRFFSFRTMIITLSLMILTSIAIYYVYNYSEDIQLQVEQRFIIASLGQSELLENIYFESRDVLYMDYWEAGKNYYPLGVPPNVPVTQKFVNGVFKVVNVSDISLVTVFLRLGIIPLLVYIFIGILFYKYIWDMDVVRAGPWNRMIHLSLLYSLPFIALASLNVDLLARQNPILFISLLFLAIGTDSSMCKKRSCANISREL